jgi:hypothetical protein
MIPFKTKNAKQQIQSKLLCFLINGDLLINPAIIRAHINDSGG